MGCREDLEKKKICKKNESNHIPTTAKLLLVKHKFI